MTVIFVSALALAGRISHKMLRSLTFNLTLSDKSDILKRSWRMPVPNAVQPEFLTRNATESPTHIRNSREGGNGIFVCENYSSITRFYGGIFNDIDKSLMCNVGNHFGVGF